MTSGILGNFRREVLITLGGRLGGVMFESQDPGASFHGANPEGPPLAPWGGDWRVIWVVWVTLPMGSTRV